MKHLTLLALSLSLACDAEPSRAPGAATVPVRVAAASDLTRAFEEVKHAFEAHGAHAVELSFGASGMLAKQLAHGAPFDVFASANAQYAREAVAAGACSGETSALYATGHLVVWSKPGMVAPARTLSELADARFRRIAIANPESAPYGKAAQQALRRAGLWPSVEPRLVYGENIKQTMQYAESGNVEAALVALSLVVPARPATYLQVDEALHEPIEQTLVACTRGDNAAGGRAFVRFVSSAAGRAIMRRYGLLLPGESLVRAP